MLTNEEIDAVLSNHGDNYVTIYRDLDFYYQLIAQAKEANALREQLATARRDALEEAAKTCYELEDDEGDLSQPPYTKGFNFAMFVAAKAIRALKEKVDSELAQKANDPVITQAQWDNACAGLGTKP